MADSIIKGSLSKGYDLNMRQAVLLFQAGKIEKPTQELLKNYFVTNILVPQLKKLKDKHVVTDSPNEISGLRKYVGDITFNNEPADLKQLNKLFQRIKKGQPIKQSQILDFTNPARKAAGLGFNESSERMANLWDAIEGLREKHKKAISKNSNPQNIIKAGNEFDKSMEELFRRNRRWLPQGTTYDKFNPGKYGWTEGSSREGYLQWQQDVYKESQAQTRAIAQELGIKFDAGHGLSLGGLKISPEEFEKLSLDVRGLIREEGQPDPDVEGGWHIRGTNSASNLAIEIAKYNRSKGSLSSRHIKDLLEINSAFTKSQSLAEYNLRNKEGFRKNTDFSRAVRNLLLHSDRDINEILARGENELLQTGIQETPGTAISQSNITGSLNNTTDVLGDTKIYTERLGQKYNQSTQPSLLKDVAQEKVIFANRMSIGPDFFNKARSVTKSIASTIGGPTAKKIVAADDLLSAASKGDTLGVVSPLTKLLTTEEILPIKDPTKLKAGY